MSWCLNLTADRNGDYRLITLWIWFNIIIYGKRCRVICDPHCSPKCQSPSPPPGAIFTWSTTGRDLIATYFIFVTYCIFLYQNMSTQTLKEMIYQFTSTRVRNYCKLSYIPGDCSIYCSRTFGTLFWNDMEWSAHGVLEQCLVYQGS